MTRKPEGGNGMSKVSRGLAFDLAEKYPLTFVDKSSRDVSLSKRYENAWDVARKAAKTLKHKFGATRVVAFGSLTNVSIFSPWSDIDLAAWGVPDEVFYAAVGAVTDLDSDFKIDLIDARSCRDSLRRVVETDGIEL